MSNFKILVCEDSPADKRNILLYLSTVKMSLPDVDITYVVFDFEETHKELINNFDLLILDLGDTASNSNAGENILMHNKGNLNIPTLVYTGTADSFGWEYKHKKNEYPFLVEKLTKIHNSGENLITFVKGYIIVRKGIQKYSLYNPYDEILNLSIQLIGVDSFNYILHNIFEKYDRKNITVFPMTSGLSGAVLFKLEIGSSKYILKLSKDIIKLKQEHENGKNLYNQFPSHLTNFIPPEEYESFDKSVLGILIKNVEGATTLFDFINCNDVSKPGEIHAFLEKLYFDSDALKDFFKDNKEGKVYWPSIFENINENKMLLARKSFTDLKAILDKYYMNFDFEDLRRLAISHDYGNLNPSNTLKDKYSTGLVLSHGDFHSKNILIQGNRPVIIDTGSIQFQHWCLDYSRLIVHIFINGLDCNTVNYFELSTLPKHIAIIDNVLEESKIELDGENDNFIIALNWLAENYTNVYGVVNRFELQLGLMKEFLQASYRFDTIPPGKRALALIGAHKCLLAANANVALTFS